MASLSKFAICLNDKHLQHSPLMGHITGIVAQKLPSICDARFDSEAGILEYKYFSHFVY